MRRCVISLIVVLGATLWAGAGAALAATSATTNAATSVKSTSATVSGTVGAGDGDTSYFFEYGTTAAYTKTTAVQTAKQGSTTVTATLSGLTASTTYHFQLVVVDGAVEPATATPGGDGTFTTSATDLIAGTVGPVAQASTGPAVSVTQTTATLTGTASASNGGAYVFQYGFNPPYGNLTKGTTIPAGSSPASAVITGLQPGTTYHFRLVVLGTSSVSSQQDAISTGVDVSFTTAAAGTTGTTGTTGSGGTKPKYGSLGLRTNRIPVNGGKATLALHCSGPASATCSGQVAISAGSSKCGSINVSTAAHRNFSTVISLSSACQIKLTKARHERLNATLKATFSTNQAPFTRNIILVAKS